MTNGSELRLLRLDGPLRFAVGATGTGLLISCFAVLVIDPPGDVPWIAAGTLGKAGGPVLVALVAFGVYLVLSTLTGFWWTYKDMKPAEVPGPASEPSSEELDLEVEGDTEPVGGKSSDAPLDEGLTSTGRQESRRLELPPELLPGGPSRGFLVSARDYYYETFDPDMDFGDALIEVRKSKPHTEQTKGRPNWYFKVRVGDFGPSSEYWIEVPHAGRSGPGASPNGARRLIGQ